MNDRRPHPIPEPRPDIEPERNLERNRECLSCYHKWRSIIPKPTDGSLWSVLSLRCPECGGRMIATSYEVGEVPPDLPDMSKDKSLLTLKTPEELALIAAGAEKARAEGKFDMPPLRERDPTERERRRLLESGELYGHLLGAKEKWNTEQLREQFEVHSFLAPFVIVTRKSDGVKGTVKFTPDPRWYFDFEPDDDTRNKTIA
jgi:hypothetical protein